MSLPEFNNRGVLDKGIHTCTGKEFITRFCYGEDTTRSKYKEVLEQLFAFSVKRGVSAIIAGGSFVTDKVEPSDLDCIIVFPNEKSIPMQPDEILVVEGCELDVMFVSETNRELIYKFMNLFSQDKYDLSVGMVEIVLDEDKDCSSWDDYENYNSIESLLEAREAYIYRNVIRGARKKKVLITVCNMKEYFLWNYEVAPVISSGGWIFAPFIYDSKYLEKYVDDFKVWLNYIYLTYETELCVFADGFGTYMLGRYFKDKSKYAKAQFDRIVLSKTLLDSNFNWDEELQSHHVKLIINLKDIKNVCKINEFYPKGIEKDKVFGEAYITGFSEKLENLIEYVYDYKKEIEKDEFKNTILPIFNLSNIIEKNNELDAKSLSDLLSKQIGTVDLFTKK